MDIRPKEREDKSDDALHADRYTIASCCSVDGEERADGVNAGNNK